MYTIANLTDYHLHYYLHRFYQPKNGIALQLKKASKSFIEAYSHLQTTLVYLLSWNIHKLMDKHHSTIVRIVEYAGFTLNLCNEL